MRLLLLFTILYHVDAARILGLFPVKCRSHQMFFEPLIKKLAERGHQLTVVSHFPLQTPKQNYTDVTIESFTTEIMHIDLAFYEDSNKYRITGVQHIDQQLIGFLPLAELSLNMCQRMVKWKPLAGVLQQEYDLVVTEIFTSDCILGLLHVFGNKAPIVGMSSSSLMPWASERIGSTDNPSYVPTISTSFTTKMTFLQRVENALMQVCLKLFHRYWIQLKEQEIIEKKFGKIPDLGDLSKNVSVLLVNTFHGLHGAQPRVPGVVEVGGIHLGADDTSIPQNLLRFINESDHGVILFSFGSIIRTSSIPRHREATIMNVLSTLKQRVVWKYEGDEDVIVGNVMKIKWLPQYQLLKHPKVTAFIGHGGLLGMTEALSTATPMLVIPFYGDQALNAAAAEAVGLGKVLLYDKLTEHSFGKAIEEVLSPEMKLSARRASQIWLDRESVPLDTAVYWTERVLRYGHQSPLYSASKHLNFFQYTLLDVVALTIVVFVFAISIIVLIIRVLCSLVRSVFIKGKVKVQ